MFLNDAGRIVERTWLEIPEHFQIADLDSFIVMANHIHGILVLIDVGRGLSQKGNPELGSRSQMFEGGLRPPS